MIRIVRADYGGFKMDDRLLERVLRYLDTDRSARIKQHMRNVLDYCKRARKGLSKEEIIDQGLNIYEKRNVSIHDIIKESINRGLVFIEQDSIILTKKGRNFLFEFYTNNESEEFRIYYRKVNQIFKDNNELSLSPLLIARWFFDGKSPKEVANIYLIDSYHSYIESYHKHLIKESGLVLNEEQFVFHFLPNLFLPTYSINRSVDLTIDGKIYLPTDSSDDLKIVGKKSPDDIISFIRMQDNLNLTRPYPNQRHVVGGENASGLYLIIGNKKEFPEEVNLTLQWNILNEKSIIHNLKIRFDFKNHPGNLFSSKQQLTRSNNIKQFSLTSFTEEDRELFEKNRVLDYTSGLDRFIINENVTLTNFPLKLHSFFHGDKYFNKWRKGQEG